MLRVGGAERELRPCQWLQGRLVDAAGPDTSGVSISTSFLHRRPTSEYGTVMPVPSLFIIV